jgi:hypothetical protein
VVGLLALGRRYARRRGPQRPHPQRLDPGDPARVTDPPQDPPVMSLSGHATWSWTSTGDLTEIAAVAAAVAVAIEESPRAQWPVLLAFAKDTVEEVLELTATGALDVNSAGGQLILAVLICGVLQTLSALMSRRP